MRKELDVITYEVIKNSLVSCCHEGSTMLEKIAFHPVIGMGRDRTTSLVDKEGNLICHGHTDPGAHYPTTELGTKEVLKDIPISTMKPGDGYITNDSLRMGTHVNEIRLTWPIFYKGEVRCFALVIVHWPDVGGPMPGTFNPRAKSSYAEGIRIPPIKIIENNEIIEPLKNLISLNVRTPVVRWCDFSAQIHVAHMMDDRMTELFDKYGVEMIEAAKEQMWDYSEATVRSMVSEWPDGEYYFEDFGDEDAASKEHLPIAVRCTMTVKGDDLTFDWSASDPQPVGSWGASHPTTTAGNFVGLMYCFPGLFPLNHGIIRAIKIITKPGTCMNVLEPAGTTGYCSGAMDKAEAVTCGCCAQPLSQVLPHRIYPGSVALNNLTLGGVNPNSGRDFVDYIFRVGGGMARSFKDGQDFFIFRFAPFTYTVPMELEERWFPIIYEGYEARPDTMGHGKFRGGCGVKTVIKMRGQGEVTIHGDREKFGPHGLGGGTNGGAAHLKLNVGTPQEQNLGISATGEPLDAGDRIFFESGGGGAYGDRLERDPQAVVEDVMDRYCTLECARDIYGVAIKIIDEEALDYQIDWEETKKLRAELAKKPLPEGPGPQEVHPIGKKIKAAREMSVEEALSDCVLVRPPGW